LQQFGETLLRKVYFLPVSFSDALLAEELFDGLNAYGVTLSKDAIIKNKFASVIGRHETNKKDLPARGKLKKTWDSLLLNIGKCQQEFGNKFPGPEEYLMLLAEVMVREGLELPKWRKKAIKANNLDEFYEEFLNDEKISFRDRKERAVVFLEESNSILTGLLNLKSINSNDCRRITFSLTSIGTRLGAMWGFALPIAFLWRCRHIDIATNKELRGQFSLICSASETSTARIMKIAKLGEANLRNFQMNSTGIIFDESINGREALDKIERLKRRLCPDNRVLEVLPQVQLSKDLAFYFLSVVLHRSPGGLMIPSFGSEYHIEHLIPKSNRLKEGSHFQTYKWYFNERQSNRFSVNSLNSLGNLLILSGEINQHILNKSLRFKMDSLSPSKPCDSAKCSGHLRKILAIQGDPLVTGHSRVESALKRIIERQAEIDSTIIAKRSPLKTDLNQLFNESEELVTKRSKALVKRMIEDGML